MIHRPYNDATGKNADERFAMLRAYFFELLQLYGIRRKFLYAQPKPGDAREPTEEELVRKWAAHLEVPVNTIMQGMVAGFNVAAERGLVVTSFRYLEPQILARVNATAESRVGQGPVVHRP